MNSTLLKSVVTFIILIILLALFLEFLNVKLSGVPIYDKVKISRNQLVYVKSKSSKINKEFIPKTENLNSNNQLLVKCGYQENGIYHLVYKPDIYGFRENHEKLYKNTEIVLIGDSFAFSSCINKPHDLKSQLERISKKKILNLSQGGSGPLWQTIVIKEFTKKTSFDYFVWIFYEGNDFDDLINEKIKERKLRSKIKIKKKNSLTSKNKDIKKNISEKEKLINEVLRNEIFKSKEDIKVNYNKFIELNKKFPEVKILEQKWQNEKLVNIKIFIAERLRGLSSLIKYFKNYPKILNNKEYDLIVNEMNNYLNKKNIKKKYIYYLPKYTRLAHKKINHPEVESLNQIKNIVKQTADKYNFEFIDGADFFHKRKIPLDIFPNKLPAHFNENGLKLTAEHINNFIFHNKN